MYELLPKFARDWLLENAWKYPNVVGFSEALMPRIRAGQLTRSEVIRFYVEQKTDILRYKDLIPAWIGIRNTGLGKDYWDTDVVKVGRIMGPQPIPPISLLEQKKRKLEIDKTKNFRPVELGISVGNETITAGSLGMLYVMMSDPEHIQYGIYDKDVAGSNAHVLTPDSTWTIDEVLQSKKVRILQRGSYHGGRVPTDVVGSYLWHQQINASGVNSGCQVGRGITWTLNKLYALLGRKTRFRTYLSLTNKIDFSIYEPSVEHELKIADGSIDVRKPFVGHLYAGSSSVGILCKISEILKARPDIKPRNNNWIDAQVGDKVKGCSFWCNYETDVIDANATVNVGGYGGMGGVAIFQNSVMVHNDNVIRGGWSGSGWFKV